jgi:hypothetical protein
MNKPTRYIIVKLDTNDDFTDLSSFCMMDLSDDILVKIKQSQAIINETKATLNIWNICLWYYDISVLPMDILDELVWTQDNLSDAIEEGFVYITEEVYNEILAESSNHDSLRVDGLTLNIGDTDFRINGNIKYGSQFESSSVTLTLL